MNECVCDLRYCAECAAPVAESPVYDDGVPMPDDVREQLRRLGL